MTLALEHGNADLKAMECSDNDFSYLELLCFTAEVTPCSVNLRV